ncbi:peptidoglycan-binding protein [Streptomyces sp. Vc74B-19]|uniref:peptidoglycan-binding protein n=1 Tax=unclassified Streptomyces TaxID=2593676 RepID=UPI001BFC6C0B|nr:MULTISPECIES: peptidoglycan-binding protein [unclassified Streptomyces]MBT3166132.1 peptidoglycan-binding protein [Streptomyces sp. Vc74B-19]
MSRWKALPADLDPRARHLVVSLRRLKDHSGLSMRQLAAKTGYGTSSWERYLGGRSLPPKEAVEAVAAVAGEDPTRLLALWEVASAVWTGQRTDPAPVTPADASPGVAPGPPARRRPPRGAVVAGVVAFVLVVASAALLVARVSGGDEGRARPVAGSSAAPAGVEAPASVPSYTCHVERIGGQWFAGMSRTQDVILASGHAGAEVAEAQCLLRRAGLPPGDIDGIYGPRTERAVQRLQQRAGLVVDGIVGPHTWGALRG